MNDKNFPAKEVNACIEKWQTRLGLSDWKIVWCIGDQYSHTIKNQNAASVHFNLTGRNATIAFSPFSKGWRDSIRHEMLELMLCTLADMAQKGNNKEEAVEAEVHVIIRRLEKILR